MAFFQVQSCIEWSETRNHRPCGQHKFLFMKLCFVVEFEFANIFGQSDISWAIPEKTGQLAPINSPNLWLLPVDAHVYFLVENVTKRHVSVSGFTKCCCIYLGGGEHNFERDIFALALFISYRSPNLDKTPQTAPQNVQIYRYVAICSKSGFVPIPLFTLFQAAWPIMKRK